MDDTSLKEYVGEWILLLPDDSYHSTPFFSPISGRNVRFCFEALYKEFNCNDNDSRVLSTFTLRLVKLGTYNLPPMLDVLANVKVTYFDGTIYNIYDDMPFEMFSNINVVTFNDVIKTVLDVDQGFTHHSNLMATERAVIIKCRMTFSYNKTTNFINQVDLLSSSKYRDLIQNYKALYDSAVFNDFTFKVGDKSFPAHKIVLSAHSPVFRNMLTHEFLESTSNCATITDADPEDFNVFLKYLYSGEIEDKSWNTVKSLCYLADKYDVAVLKNECVHIAISLLSVDLVCDILQVAYDCHDLRLKTAAKEFAVQNMKQVVLTEKWKELVTNHSLVYELTTEYFSN